MASAKEVKARQEWMAERIVDGFSRSMVIRQTMAKFEIGRSRVYEDFDIAKAMAKGHKERDRAEALPGIEEQEQLLRAKLLEATLQSDYKAVAAWSNALVKLKKSYGVLSSAAESTTGEAKPNEDKIERSRVENQKIRAQVMKQNQQAREIAELAALEAKAD